LWADDYSITATRFHRNGSLVELQFTSK